MAKLCVYFDKSSSTWKVSRLVEEHNHELIPLRFVHLIPNHRRMTDSDRAQVDSMHRHGIATSQILGFLAGQAGGYEGVGFSKKDLYNYIDRNRRDRISDGDANAAIGYLHGKADYEPMTVARYSATDDGQLGNLFWADGLSRVDYQYFGDVVAFDSTYKKNKYNKPLVIFSGTNHHRQTCIFGFALLIDETATTYKWLLEHFLDVMMGKKPSVVVTDGDKAMREAIKVFFPNATHRLCAWHLQKNATSNIKDSGFCDAFKRNIYANFDCDEFVRYWHDKVEEFGLHDNKWVKKAYKRRTMWANAYLRDIFCAGFRTTSRCEGINSFIKRFTKSRHSILELVQNLERAVKEYRNNELVAQFKSIYGEPVLTTGLESIERGAADLYTREIFKDVKKQMEAVCSLFILGCERIGTTSVYRVSKYGNPEREYMVLFDRNLEQYECKCRMWNSYGIPCSHMFCVMKHEHILELPGTLIMKRWCKNAKTYDQSRNEAEEDSEKVVLLRYGALCAASQWMSFLGAKKLPYFRHTMDEICRISTELEEKCGLVKDGPSGNDRQKVGDPVVVKTKGAPVGCKDVIRKRRCSNCSLPGHTKRNCPTQKGGKSYTCEDNTLISSSDDEANSKGAAEIQIEKDVVESAASKTKVNVGLEAGAAPPSGIRGVEAQLGDQSKVFFAGPQINQFYPPQFYLPNTQFISQNGFTYPVQQNVPESGGQLLCNAFRGPEYAGFVQNQYVVDPGHQWYLQNLQQTQKPKRGTS